MRGVKLPEVLHLFAPRLYFRYFISGTAFYTGQARSLRHFHSQLFDRWEGGFPAHTPVRALQQTADFAGYDYVSHVFLCVLCIPAQHYGHCKVGVFTTLQCVCVLYCCKATRNTSAHYDRNEPLFTSHKRRSPRNTCPFVAPALTRAAQVFPANANLSRRRIPSPALVSHSRLPAMAPSSILETWDTRSTRGASA